MGFRITAPVKGINAVIGGVRFTNSVAETDNLAVMPYFRRQQYQIEDLDEIAAAEKAAADERAAAAALLAAKAPAKSANKPEWVAFAVTQGMPEADAEATTKEALVERFGDKEGVGQ